MKQSAFLNGRRIDQHSHVTNSIKSRTSSILGCREIVAISRGMQDTAGLATSQPEPPPFRPRWTVPYKFRIVVYGINKNTRVLYDLH